MVFSSAIFLFIFLPVTFLAYHAVPGLKASESRRSGSLGSMSALSRN